MCTCMHASVPQMGGWGWKLGMIFIEERLAVLAHDFGNVACL